MRLDWACVFVPVLQEQNVLIFSDVKQLSRFCSLLPEASERGNSLMGKKLHYRGIQSLFLTKRKELWLSANGRFRMRSRFARNCGYAGMEDLECAVDYHVLSSPADICEQWETNLSFRSADVRGAGTRDKPHIFIYLFHLFQSTTITITTIIITYHTCTHRLNT